MSTDWTTGSSPHNYHDLLLANERYPKHTPGKNARITGTRGSKPGRKLKECNQCGKCCIKYADGGLSASSAEIEWWQIYRPEIAAYVANGNIWVSPMTGLKLSHCPWLKKEPTENKYRCSIYYDRPDDCKHYPTHINEMISDECEMIEVKDLRDTAKAQDTLDIIMSDSRPAYSR